MDMDDVLRLLGMSPEDVAAMMDTPADVPDDAVMDVDALLADATELLTEAEVQEVTADVQENLPMMWPEVVVEEEEEVIPPPPECPPEKLMVLRTMR